MIHVVGGDKPRIGITLGDPVGIGPEIVVGALSRYPDLLQRSQLAVVGDERVLERACRILGIDVSSLHGVEIHHVPLDGVEREPWGLVSALAGLAAVTWVEAAVTLCMNGSIDAIVTAPIHKEAIWAAGVPHAGHTELLAHLSGAEHPQTMFEVRGIRIFFATRHLSLRTAIDHITKDLQLRSIRDAVDALRILGLPSPRLAVAALNPHGGESGRFGREEIDAIAPAVAEARALGLSVTGPVPADSVFAQALAGRYDAVLSQYHDQGHIAAKTIDFDGTVSVTMGLPFVRTSVDHGTAFDIAGAGRANPAAMASAIRAATRMAQYGLAIRAAYGKRPLDA